MVSNASGLWGKLKRRWQPASCGVGVKKSSISVGYKRLCVLSFFVFLGLRVGTSRS